MSTSEIDEDLRHFRMWWNEKKAEAKKCDTTPEYQAWRDLQHLHDKLWTPEVESFTHGVVLEAQHQRERWGVDHDAGKEPMDWFWLVGYLAGKALRAAITGDMHKAKHHCISTAAVLANWHAFLSGEHSAFRPGIGPEDDGSKAVAYERAEQLRSERDNA